MHTEPRPSHPASNPEVRYERTDAKARPLYQFLFWISAITIITAILSAGVLKALESWRERASTRATMASSQDVQTAPAPRLQTQEPKDLAAFRKEEAEILSTYGVVDRDKGVFRIPIDEAMKLMLQRGLPTAADPASFPPAAVAGSPGPARP